LPRTQLAGVAEDQTATESEYVAPAFRGEEALGYCLRRAQVSVFQKFISTFEDVQLRPVEFSILTLIQDNPGRKQTEICRALGINRANFVPIIDGLQARDLVERRSSPGDRRANPLYLTRTGSKFIQAVHKRHEALEREFTLRIGGTSKRGELMEMLRLLV
jgi:DNA-binding MarR family transcriptional regulator